MINTSSALTLVGTKFSRPYAFTSFYRRHLQCFILMTKFNHQLSMCKRFFAEFCVFPAGGGV